MPGTMKITYSVSATPKVTVAGVNNEHQAITVIHENVRTSIGGSGEITSDDITVNGAWVDGTNTPVSSNSGTLGISAATDMLIIKHLSVLASDGTTASAAADTLLVQATGALTIAELKNGEAIVLPRPATNILLATGNGSNHVNVEVTILGS
tara:strand:- start:13 stop:468 length:456 start_codon:yes stop_codon:yes gene_type:complete